MICKSALLILCVGCTEDVPTLYANTTANTMVVLAPPDDNIPMAYGHYRWELLETPSNAGVAGLHDTAETPTIAITPPLRGIYAYDRWFVGQSATQLSYHVLVTVDGAAPTAAIEGPTTITLGQAALFDGTASTNPEHRTLSYNWRLAVHPAQSTATLDNVLTAATGIGADVAGDYVIELRVFDGELWSAPTTLTLTAQ